MTDQSAIALINAVIYIVPLIALIVSILTFVNASKERHAKSAAESAKLGLKMDHNSEKLDGVEEKVDDVDEKFDKLLEGYHENHESIEKHEQRLDSLETRADKLEHRFDTLEARVTEYHIH